MSPDPSQLDDPPIVYVEKRVNTLISRTGGERGPVARLRDDLMSAGLLALVQAQHRWRPDFGAPLGGYAHQRVVGALIDELRRNDLATRQERLARRAGTAVALPRRVELDDLSSIADAGPDPLEQLEERRRRTALEAALERLPERLRAIIVERLHGDSLEEIADARDLSPSRVCKLIREAERQLKYLVRGEEPPPVTAPRQVSARHRRRWLRQVAARVAAITASAGAAS